jgi:hypothetical protein
MSYTPPPPPPDQGGPGDGSSSTPPGYGPPPPGYGGPGGPGQGGYGGGPYGGPPKNNGKAVASLIIGITSVVLGLCCGFLGLVGIVGVFLGRTAQKEIVTSNGALTGAGMAKAGVVLGIIGAVLAVIMTIVNIWFMQAGYFDFSTSP